MYEVIYMKADYEPWWLFDDWREKVLLHKQFHIMEEANIFFHTLHDKLAAKYDHHETRKECFFAFWSDHEKVFCEGCDESVQLFHGIILMENGIPSPAILRNNSNI